MIFRIKEPIWKNKSVGLNEAHLEANNEVEVLWKDRHGERLWPYTYTVTKELAMTKEVMIVRGRGIPAGKQIRLRIVPISELSIKTGV